MPPHWAGPPGARALGTLALEALCGGLGLRLGPSRVFPQAWVPGCQPAQMGIELDHCLDPLPGQMIILGLQVQGQLRLGVGLSVSPVLSSSCPLPVFRVR